MTTCTPVCRLCGRYLAIFGRPIRVTVPAVTVVPTALVGSLIRSSNLPHSLQRGVHTHNNRYSRTLHIIILKVRCSKCVRREIKKLCRAGSVRTRGSCSWPAAVARDWRADTAARGTTRLRSSDPRFITFFTMRFDSYVSLVVWGQF